MTKSERANKKLERAIELRDKAAKLLEEIKEMSNCGEYTSLDYLVFSEFNSNAGYILEQARLLDLIIR